METENIPENFQSIIIDFTKDLTTTFPEYSYLWSKWSTGLSDTDKRTLFEFCMTVYPERFFDILYQNADIFKPDSTTNTVFLPNTEFKLLFNCDGVSENTKKSLWKYLQLVLFTVIGNVKDKNTFGESMNLFDGIDENELQEKLKDTMSGITDFFKNMGDISGEGESNGSSGKEGDKQETRPHGPNIDKMFENMSENMPEFKNLFERMPGMPEMPGMPGMSSKMPDIENMQDHLKALFNGKIGSLAKDMAEEISHEFSDILGEDANDVKDTNELLKKLMKDPKKIMDLMKTVGGKLDTKMKNGEISKDEIMKEASELLSKMKDMGGADQFNEMFKNLAKNMGGMGKNMKVDTNALSRMAKKNSIRERLLQKLEQKKQAELQNQMTYSTPLPAAQSVNYSLQATNTPNNFVFRLPEQGGQSKSYTQQELLEQLESEAAAEPATQKTTNKKKKKKTGKK